MKIDSIKLERTRVEILEDQRVILTPDARWSLIARISTALRQLPTRQPLNDFLAAAPSYSDRQIRSVAAAYRVGPPLPEPTVTTVTYRRDWTGQMIPAMPNGEGR